MRRSTLAVRFKLRDMLLSRSSLVEHPDVIVRRASRLDAGDLFFVCVSFGYTNGISPDLGAAGAYFDGFGQRLRDTPGVHRGWKHMCNT